MYVVYRMEKHNSEVHGDPRHHTNKGQKQRVATTVLHTLWNKATQCERDLRHFAES